jgi:hypothetical protein
LQTDANGNKSITDVTNGIGGAGANSTVGTMFFGTISGGAGAALTGGNFWQGAVTGLIVSGLNHVMHSYEFRKSLLGRFKSGGLKPFDKAHGTKEHILKLHESVEGLSEDYISGESPDFSFEENSGNHAAEYDDNNRTVFINKNDLTTNYKLATDLFHEYRHAWQHVSGFSGEIKGRYGYSMGSPQAPSVSQAYLEYDAYNYQIKLGISDGRIVGNRDFYLKWFNTHKTHN